MRSIAIPHGAALRSLGFALDGAGVRAVGLQQAFVVLDEGRIVEAFALALAPFQHRMIKNSATLPQIEGASLAGSNGFGTCGSHENYQRQLPAILLALPAHSKLKAS